MQELGWATAYSKAPIVREISEAVALIVAMTLDPLGTTTNIQRNSTLERVTEAAPMVFHFGASLAADVGSLPARPAWDWDWRSGSKTWAGAPKRARRSGSRKPVRVELQTIAVASTCSASRCEAARSWCAARALGWRSRRASRSKRGQPQVEVWASATP